jgi:hypothetical protein
MAVSKVSAPAPARSVAPAKQAQNSLKPERLSHEFSAASGGLNASVRGAILEEILSRPAEAGRARAVSPAGDSLEAQKKTLNENASRIKSNTRSIKDNDAAKERVDQAVKIAQEIIETLNSSELRSVWERLHRLLDEIRAEADADKAKAGSSETR